MALSLRQLDPFIGSKPLRQVNRGALQEFIDSRRAAGVKTKSINHGLATVRRVLNLAAGEWFDEQGLTWLESAPKIKLLPVTDSRAPYPLNFDEQARLFRELPLHLARMALFKVNTGCREQEVCKLRWEWEVQVPEFSSSVFIIPNAYVKNGEDRLVVLNQVARSMINEVRGDHTDFVFTYRGEPVTKINNSAWKCARERAAANKVCALPSRKTPALVMLRKKTPGG